ncbi:MAG: glycosyltransferase [Armatimonadetes bacterium]|nr:glycosyltransferase [Armatimonadota bacterium]
MIQDTLTAVLDAADRGDWQMAWTLVEGAADQTGPDYEWLLTSAMVLARLERDHQARSHLLRAIDSAPERPDAYLHLAQLLAGAGAWERALGYLHLAHECAPEQPTALNAMADLYAEAGLPYAAKQALRLSLGIDPGQNESRRTLADLDAAFPDRPVTVYVPSYNATAFLDRVIPAVLEQSYPLTELLIIDDGSTDDSVQMAAKYPVRIVTHGDNRGLAHARNTALLAATTQYLAHIDADVLPDRYWLERCMLNFESERLNHQDGQDTGARLGGVMGRLEELNDATLPDQWRVLHMGQHHGDDHADDVRHLYGCNSVWLREALFGVGGHDPLYRTNGEDCDASERVRTKGYRLAYEPAARCRHLRRDTLESVLRTIWRYHTPYFEYRYGVFDTGKPADVIKKLPENMTRHQDDWHIDQERRSWHLVYLTFLGLPWRMLSDLRLATSKAQGDDARCLGDTHAAVYLGLFTLLDGAGAPEDLQAMIHEDLAPCRPLDPALAEYCNWENTRRAATTNLNGADHPGTALMARDEEAVLADLAAVDNVYAAMDATTWSMVRASAYRLRDEASNAAKVRPGGPRVAIVNAPWAEGDRIGVRAGSRWPFTQEAHGQRVPCYVPFPFFLATASAMLRERGFEVLLVDAIAEGLYSDEFMRRLEGWEPDLVLMETATASHEIDQDWALRLKERLGDSTQLLFCGPHATAIADDLMAEAPQVDGILLGEFEPTLVELCERLRDGQDPEGILGLLWRDDDGTVHAVHERRPLPPMSEFPWPDRTTLPMYNYFDSFAGAMPWPNVQMHASRGCPFQCIFCVWPQVVYNSHSYRTRDNEEIVAEMAFLLDRYGFKAIYYDDDTFNIQDNRIIDLCNRIEAAHFGVPITAMGRADTSSREAFEAMKRAGLVGIKFGVETGDVEMMQRIKKNLDLDKVAQAVRWCKELGLGVHLTFSFGGPGETYESARRTMDLALELDPDTVQFSLMTPFPGTSMYADAVRDGTLLTTDWKQFDGARYTVVKGQYLSKDELESVLLEAHWRWALHTTCRQARQQIGRDVPTTYVADAAELDQLPPESVDLLVLSTPVNRVLAEGWMDQLPARLAPGGRLVLGRTGPESLPQGWDDELLLGWAKENGLQAECSMQGFNHELFVSLAKSMAPSLAKLLARIKGN